MGLQQVSTTTLDDSSKTSSLIVTGIDDDSDYVFAFNNLNVENDITLGLRFTISGSPFALANYNFSRKQFNSGATSGSVAGASQTFINMQIVSDTTCFGSGIFYLQHFNDSSSFSMCTFSTVLSNTSSYSGVTGSSGGAELASNGATDGINLLTASGYEINSGTYTLFKVV